MRKWGDAAGIAPVLVANAMGRGVLPMGLSSLATLRREGLSDLHWKVVGDALVRFFRSSGPVLTKLGQVLATRDDLLPRATCERLEELYAGQPAMRRAQLERSLERAYGSRSPFAQLDEEPLAVGSIGQVHRARLRDGSRVVVKLVRPGIGRAIERDLNAAGVFAGLLFRFLSGDRSASRRLVARALDELGAELAREADLENEADAYEEFGRRFASNPRVCVPRCYREWSTRDVLVLEELRGEPLSALRRRGVEQPAEARRAAQLALREILSQVFDEGCFHADPHGGNLLILEDGRLGLIDLGLTGELGPRDRKNIARAVKAFLARDPDAAIRILLEFGTVSPDFDLPAFKRDVREVFRKKGRGAAAQAVGRGSEGTGEATALEGLVNDLLSVARSHDIHVPPSTTLLIKTLVTIEGVARSLDPEINVVVTALPIVLRSLTPRWLRWSHWTRRD